MEEVYIPARSVHPSTNITVCFTEVPGSCFGACQSVTLFLSIDVNGIIICLTKTESIYLPEKDDYDATAKVPNAKSDVSSSPLLLIKFMWIESDKSSTDRQTCTYTQTQSTACSEVYLR